MSRGEPLTVELPAYEYPPPWIPPEQRASHPDYSTNLNQFLPRMVRLTRTRPTETLGFNVRGGKEYYCGIFISKVMRNTDAERLGLKEGDQILSLNQFSFGDIEHSQAVKILKSLTELELQVRYFPYGYRKTFS